MAYIGGAFTGGAILPRANHAYPPRHLAHVGAG